MHDVARLLRWFDKGPGEILVGEAIMPDATLAELQALFDVPAENPMSGCWDVRPAQVDAVAALARVSLNLNRYSHQVQADATGDD